MDQSYVIDVGRQGVQVALMVSMPILAVSLFVGVLVSIFQAVTQIQEQTLTFVPKLVAVGVALAIMGGWMLTTLVSYMRLCFEHAARLG